MNAYYNNTIQGFLNDSEVSIMGSLSIGSTAFNTLLDTQTMSWISFIQILKDTFHETGLNKTIDWKILLEYSIPRRSKRIDCVILANNIIIVIEFKDDANKYEPSFRRQVEDYCLDLKDFHKESRNRKIVPIVLAPNADDDLGLLNRRDDYVQPTINSNSRNLGSVIRKACEGNLNNTSTINLDRWDGSEYLPTPTIIEAAQALFAGQNVREISQSHAGAKNLSITTERLINAIIKAKTENSKVICFITGVPGAGKTLVGLNIVHKEELYQQEKSLAAYFSGNGPLIKVLREAIVRDRMKKNREFTYGNRTKNDIRREVETQIQNLHSFIEHHVTSEHIPAEHVAIFDEAQRCWDAEHLYRQNKRNSNRKKNPILLHKSEPELLLEIMDRHNNWAVMIALVGSGQEINTGEAGIGEWGRVIQERFRHWNVMVAPELLQGDQSISGNKLFNEDITNINIVTSNDLHLNVSLRSYKAKELTDWVNYVLSNEPAKAKELHESLDQKFPLCITRNLKTAKDWLKERKIGTRRIGLVASSGAQRLRPYGINVKEAIDEPNWFLNDEYDIRSSFYLELVATEFGIQGLEIDWAGLCWGGDLRWNKNSWDFKRFSGSKWQDVKKDITQQYIINKYRVLLTRAREGMIIWVPEGDIEDKTRLPSIYNDTSSYLKFCGLTEI